jgi:hypothetical protein
MNKNELKAGTNDEQRTTAESGTSAGLEQNGLLSASAVIVVSYGGGTDSTAMLIGMAKNGIVPDHRHVGKR